jgi:hypothetical protein
MRDRSSRLSAAGYANDEVIPVNLEQDHPNVALKTFAYCVLVLSTLLVLAWPLFFVFSAMISGVHLNGKSVETARSALVIYILSYPMGYLAGLAYLIARRMDQPKGRVWWTKWAVLFFLLPLIQLGLLVLIWILI